MKLAGEKVVELPVRVETKMVTALGCLGLGRVFRGAGLLLFIWVRRWILIWLRRVFRNWISLIQMISER